MIEMIEDLRLSYGIVFQAGISLSIFLIFLLLRKLFTKYVMKTIHRITAKTKIDLDAHLFEAFNKPLQSFFIYLGLYVSLIYLPLTTAQDILVTRVFRSIIVFLLARGFYNFVGTGSHIFKGIEEKFDLDINKILIPFVSKIIRFLIVVFSVAIIAGEWEYDVNGFIAGLGIGGLAFALAAQDTAANIFGGIVIIIDKPFSIGDWIHSNAVEGTVEDITFRSTKVRTFAQAVVTVPNSTLTNNPLTNWTRMGRRQITFKLGVTYSTSRDKLQKCVDDIKNMLRAHPEIHQETIFVNFDSFNDSSLDIFLYFFTKTTNWGEFLKVKEDVNFKIMEILEGNQVAVAFPSRSIYLENDTKDVTIKEEARKVKL